MMMMIWKPEALLANEQQHSDKQPFIQNNPTRPSVHQWHPEHLLSSVIRLHRSRNAFETGGTPWSLGQNPSVVREWWRIRKTAKSEMAKK